MFFKAPGKPYNATLSCGVLHCGEQFASYADLILAHQPEIRAHIGFMPPIAQDDLIDEDKITPTRQPEPEIPVCGPREHRVIEPCTIQCLSGNQRLTGGENNAMVGQHRE